MLVCRMAETVKKDKMGKMEVLAEMVALVGTAWTVLTERMGIADIFSLSFVLMFSVSNGGDGTSGTDGGDAVSVTVTVETKDYVNFSLSDCSVSADSTITAEGRSIILVSSKGGWFLDF